jgi:hypothetical protein
MRSHPAFSCNGALPLTLPLRAAARYGWLKFLRLQPEEVLLIELSPPEHPASQVPAVSPRGWDGFDL